MPTRFEEKAEGQLTQLAKSRHHGDDGIAGIALQPPPLMATPIIVKKRHTATPMTLVRALTSQIIKVMVEMWSRTAFQALFRVGYS